MKSTDTFLQLIELVLTQNASTKTILEQLELLRYFRDLDKKSKEVEK